MKTLIKKSRMTTLLFDKVDVRAKKLLEKKRHIAYDKMINLPERHNDPAYVCNKNRASKCMSQIL